MGRGTDWCCKALQLGQSDGYISRPLEAGKVAVRWTIFCLPCSSHSFPPQPPRLLLGWPSTLVLALYTTLIICVVVWCRSGCGADDTHVGISPGMLLAPLLQGQGCPKQLSFFLVLRTAGRKPKFAEHANQHVQPRAGFAAP